MRNLDTLKAPGTLSRAGPCRDSPGSPAGKAGVETRETQPLVAFGGVIFPNLCYLSIDPDRSRAINPYTRKSHRRYELLR
ncbi:hypothetical protein APED_11140 [Acanthopleuribacter pedis]